MLNHYRRTSNFIKKLFVTAGLIIVASCGTNDEQENPEPPAVGNLGPANSVVQIIGSNCRAEVISGPNEEKRYRSVYMSVHSDGSEQVENVVETTTPCP